MHSASKFYRDLRCCNEIDPCEFRIISNGLRLKDRIADALLDLGPHMVSVSIDGFSPSVSQSRGKAHRYNDVVENVIGFAEKKAKLGVKWPLIRVSFVESLVTNMKRKTS